MVLHSTIMLEHSEINYIYQRNHIQRCSVRELPKLLLVVLHLVFQALCLLATHNTSTISQWRDKDYSGA